MIQESSVRKPLSALLRFWLKTFAVLFFGIVCLRYIYIACINCAKTDKYWIYSNKLTEGIIIKSMILVINTICQRKDIIFVIFKSMTRVQILKKNKYVLLVIFTERTFTLNTLTKTTTQWFYFTFLICVPFIFLCNIY